MASVDFEKYSNNSGEGSLSPFTTVCIVFMLVLFGLIIIYTSSYSIAISEGRPHYYYFMRAGVTALSAFALALVAAFIPADTISRAWVLLFPLSLILAAARTVSAFIGIFPWLNALELGPLFAFTALFISCDLIPQSGEMGWGRVVSSVSATIMLSVILILCLVLSSESYYILISVILICSLLVKKSGSLGVFITFLLLVLGIIAFRYYIGKPVFDTALFKRAFEDAGAFGSGLGKGEYKSTILAEPFGKDAVFVLLDELGVVFTVFYAILVLLLTTVALRTSSRLSRMGNLTGASFSVSLAVFVSLRVILNLIAETGLIIGNIKMPFISYDLFGGFLDVFACCYLYGFVLAGSKNANGTELPGVGYYGF